MSDPTIDLQTVYREHFNFVWRSLRRLGVSDADLPDVVQDVFIVAHRKLAGFEGRSRLTTWLFGIMLRVVSDRRRLACVRLRVDDERAIEERVDPRDLGAEIERRHALAVLDGILDGMPLEQRAVFTLFELEGMAGHQIAEALELPLGTVKSDLARGHEQLRTWLGHARGGTQ